MKKMRLIMSFLALGALFNLSSCSNDDETTKNTTPATLTTNSALIDDALVTSTETPTMSDKTAVLKTTAGIFEIEFANKPTESGTYSLKSDFSTAKILSSPKEVTFKYTDKDNMIYKAADGTGGSITVTIKDGKLFIDIINISVCNQSKCKKISVKYDFPYTPPVKPVDPTPVDPTPSTEAPGTGIVDGVKTTDTKYKSTGTFMVLSGKNIASLAVDGGTFQLRFKDKPKAGTYKVTLDSPTTPLADNEVAFSYVPPTITDFNNYFASSVNSTGTVTVKASGDKFIIEAVNIKAFNNTNKDISKTFSAYLSVSL